MPRAQVRGQMAFDEQLVEDVKLEQALEQREQRRESLNAVRLEYDTAHEAAKAEIEKLELPVDKAVRVGRFRISRSAVSARQVTFDTKATTRVRITLLDGDDGDASGSPVDLAPPAPPEREFAAEAAPPSKHDENVVDLATAAGRARAGR